MKLNCDLGEGYGAWKMGNDEQIMAYIDMANIACGFHASDPSVMARTVELAKTHKVQIGAHPGYPDLQGFGRRNMKFSQDEIIHLVQYQIGALMALCIAQGVKLEYVKPHGALYNTMMVDKEVMDAMLIAVSQLSEDHNQNLSLMVLANSQSPQIQQYADHYAVPLIFEAFADRSYTDDGHLVPRSQTGAVLENDIEILKNIQGLIEHQQVTSINGKKLSIKADSICVHGDSSQALNSVKRIRQHIASQ